MGEYRIGEVIKSPYGTYQVDDVLRGGMGIVYVTSNVENNQKRVFKTYQDKFRLESYILDRFLKESRIWIDLSVSLNNPFEYPFIVRAFYTHKIGSQPFLELEFIKGGNWSIFMRSLLDFPTILDLSVQFCRGMHGLNRNLDGFVHRDIKPENILFKKLEGELLILKITDFGLADVKEELLKQSSDKKVIAGTRLYMSPEQINGSRNLDFRSDIFSFGLVLFETLTMGREHGSTRWFDFMLQVQNELIYSDGKLNFNGMYPNTPKGLDTVIMKCLNKDPDKRYEGFDVLETAIREIIFQEGFDADEFNTAFSGGITIDTDYFSEETNIFQLDLRRALSYAELGEPMKAIELLDNLLESYPQNALILANKGRILLIYLGRVDEATQLLDLSLNIDPTNEYTWTYKGMAYEQLGLFEEEDKCYAKAISINPNFLPALRNKGALYSNQGKFQEALDYFGQAEAIQEDDALLHRCKGITYEKLGNLQQAITSFKRAFELDHRDIDSMIDCSNLLMREHDFLGCEKILMDAIKLNVNNPKVWLVYGACNFNQGRYKEAAMCFDRVQLLDPNLAAQYNIGKLIIDCNLRQQS